ncbi:MAG: hypothetical protein ACM3YE_09000 [Bacteroidota bacterium]
MRAKKRIPGQSIRNTWHINPRTRVHDNDIRKNKKTAPAGTERITQFDENQTKRGCPGRFNWTTPNFYPSL